MEESDKLSAVLQDGMSKAHEVEEPATNPTTPINRSFDEIPDPSLVTAIISPSSDEVQAARARARQRKISYIRASVARCDTSEQTPFCKRAPTPAVHAKEEIEQNIPKDDSTSHGEKKARTKLIKHIRLFVFGSK